MSDIVFSDDQILQSLQKLPIGVLFSSPKGDCVYYVNTFFSQSTGYDPEDFKDVQVEWVLFQDEGLERQFSQKIEQLNPGENTDLDGRIKRQDGSSYSAHLDISFVKGEPGYLIILVTDVTSRRAYEQVIENSFDNFIKTSIDLDAAMKKIKDQQSVLAEYKQKMSNDLNIAKNIQDSIIPMQFPSNSRIDMFGVSIPTDELGGDYFDIFEINEDTYGILITDVSGHGVPSSLITTMIKAFFSQFTQQYIDPAEVLAHVNQRVSTILEGTGFYLTAIYAVVDLYLNTVRVSIAGHDYGLCFSPESGDPVPLGEGAEGTILGIFPGAEYSSVTVEISPGSRIVLYTDGIVEARSSDRTFFTKERLIDLLGESNHLPAKKAVQEVIKKLDSFLGNVKAEDDRTILICDIGRQVESSDEEKSDVLDEAESYIREKRYDDALACLETGRTLIEDPGRYFFLTGQAFGGLKYYDKAVESCMLSLAESPDNYLCYYYLGKLEYIRKHYDRAELAFKKVQELAGDYGKVSEYLKRLSQQDP